MSNRYICTPSRDKMASENVGFKIFLRKYKDKDEIRRFNIRDCFLNNFEYLEAQIIKLFPELNNKKFATLWHDGEDEINISSDEELILALSCMQGNLKKLSIEVDPQVQRKNQKVAYAVSLPGPNEMQVKKQQVFTPSKKVDDQFSEIRMQIKEMLLKNMSLKKFTPEATVTPEASTSASVEEPKNSEVETPPYIDSRKSSSCAPDDSTSDVCVDSEKLDKLSDLVYELAKITRSLSLRCPCESHQVEDKPNTPITEEVKPKVMSLNESVVALRFVLDNVYLLKDKFFTQKKNNVCMQQDSYLPAKASETNTENFQFSDIKPKEPALSEVKARDLKFLEVEANKSLNASSNHDSGEGSESEAADIVLDCSEPSQDLDIIDCSSVKTISESSEELEERWTLLNNDDMEIENEKVTSGAEDQADDLMEFESHIGQQSGVGSIGDAEGLYPRLGQLNMEAEVSAVSAQPSVQSQGTPVSNLEMRAIFPHVAQALKTLELMGFDVSDSKTLYLTELYEGNVEAVIDLLLL